jgi:mono/diheme cytochrome c family protein
MSDGQARSIASYVRKLRAGVAVPTVSEDTRVASLVIGRYCANCHMIDGEGSSIGPDLTRVGGQRDAKWLHDWITQPDAVDPAANMPAFGEVLTEHEMMVVVNFLAARK